MRQIYTLPVLLLAVAGFVQSTNPVPSLESVSPAFVWAGSGDTILALRGKNFRPDSIVQVYSEETLFETPDGPVIIPVEPPAIPSPILSLIPRFVSSAELVVNLPESRLRLATTLRVAVMNPLPGGGRSMTVTFQVRVSGSLLSGSSIISGRFGHRSALLEDGNVLMIGGVGEGQRVLSSVEIRDRCTGTWSPGPSLSISRFRPTLTVLLDGKVLVTGGVTDGDVPLDTVEIFDPATRTWSTGPSMSTARILHTATLLPGGAVLVAGGFASEDVPLADVEIYDPLSGTWTRAAPMRSPRAGHSAVLLPSGKVLVAGGAGWGEVLASSEIYDPAAGIWTPGGSMVEGRYRHEATLLEDGSILATGGLGLIAPNSSLASVELYDPQADRWISVRSMETGRYGHTATLLPGGLVFVAGGLHFNQYPFSAMTLLYDRHTGRWIRGPVLFSRGFHTATLLSGGNVLLAGGAGASRRVELYQPGLATAASEQLVRDFASPLDAGTYTATVSLRCGAAPTSWKMEIVPNDGVLPGSIRFGGQYDRSQTATNSATFLLDRSDVVTLSGDAQPPSPDFPFPSVFADLLDASGRAIGNFSRSQFFSALLLPGQYTARLSTSSEGRFALSIATGSVSGRVSVDGYSAPGITGFCEFRVPNGQQVRIKIFKTGSGSAAPDVLDLLLTDAEGRPIPQVQQP